MTIGSPFAASVSGPGTEDTYATRLLSGDQATVRPVPGSGAFVPVISATKRTPLPSGRATTRPVLPAARPRYAIHCESGDHWGSPDGSLSPPNRTDFVSASVITHSCV